MTAATAPLGQLPATRTAALPSAASGLAGAAVIITFGNLDVRHGEQGGLGPAIGTGIVCVVLAAALFGLGVPRWRGARRPALVLGVLTVVSLAAFWSGVVPVLAAATVAVAPPGRATDKAVRVTRTLAVTAAVLAAGFTVVNFVR